MALKGERGGRCAGFDVVVTGSSARFRGDFDPETEQNTLVVAWQPRARLDRFQGDFRPETAQNIESDHHANARTASRAAPPNTGGRQPDSPASPRTPRAPSVTAGSQMAAHTPI